MSKAWRICEQRGGKRNNMMCLSLAQSIRVKLTWLAWPSYKTRTFFSSLAWQQIWWSILSCNFQIFMSWTIQIQKPHLSQQYHTQSHDQLPASEQIQKRRNLLTKCIATSYNNGCVFASWWIDVSLAVTTQGGLCSVQMSFSSML